MFSTIEHDATTGTELLKMKQSAASTIELISSAWFWNQLSRRWWKDGDWGQCGWGGCWGHHNSYNCHYSRTAALARKNVSDRKAVFCHSRNCQALDELALNRQSICRNRVEYRVQRAANIKAEFQGNIPLVVHWDGKLISNQIGKQKVDQYWCQGKKFLCYSRLPSFHPEQARLRLLLSSEPFKTEA